MANINFKISTQEPITPITFNPLLFSKMEHMQINNAGTPYFCTVEKNGEIRGLITFEKVGNMAKSPSYAPYSGFQLKDEVSLKEASNFIDFIEVFE